MEGKMKIYYDEEGDYLEIFIKKGAPSYGEDINSGITIFKEEETDEIIGIGILNFRKKARNFDELDLDLPFEVNFSAMKI
jgi:hypothetical protein|tara:strand:+ start:2165 stop:2404 length:240 start_codon:yes stop_codon:yes gene_type:complete